MRWHDIYSLCFSQLDGDNDSLLLNGRFSFLIAIRLIRNNWKAVIENYLTSLIGEIWFDLKDKQLLRNILLSLLVRFGLIYKINSYCEISYFPYWQNSILICRIWAFQIIQDRPLGLADWVFVLGWRKEAWILHWTRHFFGLDEWVFEPIFQTLSVAPQPLCTECVGKGCNSSRIGCNFHVSVRGWVVRALSPSYVL